MKIVYTKPVVEKISFDYQIATTASSDAWAHSTFAKIGCTDYTATKTNTCSSYYEG